MIRINPQASPHQANLLILLFKLRIPRVDYLHQLGVNALQWNRNNGAVIYL